MTKDEIVKRLRRIAEHAVHSIGEETYIVSLDEGIALNEAADMIEIFNGLADELSPSNIISTLRARIGEKPKFHKGRYGKKYDYWTCGNCGACVNHGVVENYCFNCGYRILWDNPRCLTGQIDEKKER